MLFWKEGGGAHGLPASDTGNHGVGSAPKQNPAHLLTPPSSGAAFRSGGSGSAGQRCRSSHCTFRCQSGGEPGHRGTQDVRGQVMMVQGKGGGGIRRGGAHQQAVTFAVGQVGMAKVPGSLEDSHDTFHVTGDAEAVVRKDEQLHSYGEG